MLKAKRLRVIVGCEFSGIVRDAFRKLGHDAWSCDLLPDENDSKYHIQGDILDVLKNYKGCFDLGIFHPTCTYLTNSGVCWLWKHGASRWVKMIESSVFFKKLLEADIPKIAVENPVMHKYAIEIIGRKHDQLIQPYQFGHAERKATCLWLKNLKPLVSTLDVKDEMMKLPKNVSQRIHYASPGPDRWKIRSRTFSGIAYAMASQWGGQV